MHLLETTANRSATTPAPTWALVRTCLNLVQVGQVRTIDTDRMRAVSSKGFHIFKVVYCCSWFPNMFVLFHALYQTLFIEIGNQMKYLVTKEINSDNACLIII